MSNPKSSCSHLHVHTCRRLCAPLSQLWRGGQGTPLLGGALPSLYSLSVGDVVALPLRDPVLLPATCRSSPERESPWEVTNAPGWSPRLLHQVLTCRSLDAAPVLCLPSAEVAMLVGSVMPASGSCRLHKNTLTGSFSYPKIVARVWMPGWLSTSKARGAWVDLSST